MKKFFFATVVLFAICAFCSFSSCTTKQSTNDPQSVVATDKAFTVQVGAEKYVVSNEPIEVESAATRGPGDVLAATKYLGAVANGATSVVKIVDALKGKKLTTFSAWTNIVPVLIFELKPLIDAAVQAKNIAELYGAAQNLTIEERAAVANDFSKRFNIPYADAERLAELIVESAVLNMKVVGEIEAIRKK